MKVCFETFGCRLNKAEALQMEADYLAKGWKVTERHADADLIVVRGCSVTSRAQRDCERLIAHLRLRYPAKQIRICGCLKDPDLSQTPQPATRIPQPATRNPQPATSNLQLATCNPQPVPTRTARAYLKVQDGCAGRCTFCIVPKFRGASRSEDFAAVLDKARRFIDAGYHEIVVTGCNLSLYASQDKCLPDLISALADLTPDCRIRLGSAEPGDCALETVHAMAEHANVCRFLHLAVQSGSEQILQAMHRPYTVKDVEKAATLASTLMPNLGLGCDLMTGFPGETERDFVATGGLLKRLPFSNAHVFPYSARPGTPAVALPHRIEREVRFKRAQALTEIIRDKRQAFAKTFVGKTVELLVEDKVSSRGWTGEYLACEPVTGAHPRKSIVRVFVTKAEKDVLYGRPVK